MELIYEWYMKPMNLDASHGCKSESDYTSHGLEHLQFRIWMQVCHSKRPAVSILKL